MTDSTVFSADNATQNPALSTAQEAATAAQQTHSELVGALVGEGKKYKNVDDLAKAYINADDFIEQLKAENRELREKTVATKTVDDILERLQQQQGAKQGDTPVTPLNGVSLPDITKLVEQAVTGLDAKKVREGNLLKADAMLKEVYGEKAAEVYKASANTPELHEAYMKLAAANPEQFVKLFTGDVPKNTGGQADSGGGVNTAVAFQSANKAADPGTKAYYDNVRRTDPSRYYSQKFQIEMDKAVRDNPQKYFGK